MSLKAIYKYGSPPNFYRFAMKLEPWCFSLGVFLIVIGTIGGLFIAPKDYQMGDAYRIIYFHVPSAYLSMSAYAAMGFASTIGIVWRSTVAFSVAKSIAPFGALITALALITGMLWGKPMWGTAWVWDARLTSEFILLLLYLGYITLHASIKEQKRADRAASLVAILGIINLPIIHYSVVWWNTLHQASTISKIDAPSIVGEMLWPLLVMIIGYSLFFSAVICRGGSAEVLMREKRSKWVKEI
ncbi:MAG: heme ABC transporter permease CcmC [Gammaproteobacteria bacterium]|jgi:heme exporter protein C|nr:heme ABC transporter permease [Gammaproteobacteria bacterium]MDP6146678.1 heme ABC transporter permease CcmC [Gammaproteobacteria bacterium]HJL79615.1 heme ABC transporter permease CcmC [Gammaproteobacteria bacterium]HJM09122.1 heme ABC transporter permease CcmC [Gammaproteobacteria bacterium]HJN01231.1 heme ABC transporter permease CcmC [Gammaproteobacteria bacterium]|tara:strand:- start:13379 stop:14107 length:729 start_codon:yes stop_codon:yes gene_type:complete